MNFSLPDSRARDFGQYRGRFAPSPTGPLHFGSLIAAVGSFLEACAQGGEWHLRMEDVDQPRCSVAAADAILHALEAFGFAWDGEVGVGRANAPRPIVRRLTSCLRWGVFSPAPVRARSSRILH